MDPGQTFGIIYGGSSPGLVVIGRVLRLGGREFESWHSIPTRCIIFHIYLLYYCMNNPKVNEKMDNF